MRVLLLAAVLLTGCVTSQVQVPSAQRASLQRQLVGEERFLKLSFFVTPFFGDDTRRLLTAEAPDQVRLLSDTSGKPISPGSVQSTLAAGTRVRVKKVDFPDAFAVVERVLMTPRSLVWVTLDIDGLPKNSPPHVLVLRPGLKDDAAFQAEIERYLTVENPALQIETWPEPMRVAAKNKQAMVEMPPEALEMAWGYPEKRVIAFEGEKKKEVWTWPGGKRAATLVDGRVAELTP